jgi:integrase
VPSFLDGYAKANRLKPSDIAAKDTIFRRHLIPALGDKRLDEITTEDVQRLKAALTERSPKALNNVLTVLSVALKTAVAWGIIELVPCTIGLLRTPRTPRHSTTSSNSNVWWPRLAGDLRTQLVVLLGGEGGLRCGEIMALEGSNVDLQKRQLCVAQSEWKGHVTMPKGGRIRYVLMTKRLTDALREAETEG